MEVDVIVGVDDDDVVVVAGNTAPVPVRLLGLPGLGLTLPLLLPPPTLLLLLLRHLW